MHKWLNPRILLFVVVSVCLVLLFSSSFIINFRPQDSNDNTTSFFSSSEKIVPTRILIPTIGVDASIKPVGLTNLKTMESPEGPTGAAWFRLGVSPGEKGSSVIAGHRGWKTGRAIFDDLDKIKLGDKVYIEDERGGTLAFVVRDLRVYHADEVVPEVWNKKDAAHLNLITCAGDWNTSTRDFGQRLVVFTDLVT